MPTLLKTHAAAVARDEFAAIAAEAAALTMQRARESNRLARESDSGLRNVPEPDYAGRQREFAERLLRLMEGGQLRPDL